MGQRSPPITSPTSTSEQRPPSPIRNQSYTSTSTSTSTPTSSNPSTRGAALLARYGGQSGPTGTASAGPIGQNTSLASFMGGKASGPRLGKLTGDGRSAPPEAALIDESMKRGNPLPGMTSGGNKPLASFLEARSLASNGNGNGNGGRISPSKEENPVTSRWGGGSTTTTTTTSPSVSNYPSRNNSEMAPPSSQPISYQSSSQKEAESRPRFSPKNSYSKEQESNVPSQQSPRIEKASFTTLYRQDSFDKSKHGLDSPSMKKEEEVEQVKPSVGRSFVTSPSPSSAAFNRDESSSKTLTSPYKSTTLPPPSSTTTTTNNYSSSIPSKSNSDSIPTRSLTSSNQSPSTSTNNVVSPAFSSNSQTNFNDKLPTASLTRLSAQKMVGQRIREAQARASSNGDGNDSSNVSRSSSSNSFSSPVKASYGVGGGDAGLKSPSGGGIRDRWPMGGISSTSNNNSSSSSSSSTTTNERKPWNPNRMGNALPGMIKSNSGREENSSTKESLSTPTRSYTEPQRDFEERQQSPIRLPGLGGAQLPSAFRNSSSMNAHSNDNHSSSTFGRPSSPTKNLAAVSSNQDDGLELEKQQKSMDLGMVRNRARPPRKTAATSGGNSSVSNKVEVQNSIVAENIPASTTVRPQSPVRQQSYERSNSPVKEIERSTSPFRQPSSYQRPSSPIKTSSYSYERPSSPVKSYERPPSPVKDYERPASPIKSWERPPSPIKSVEPQRPSSPAKNQRSWETSQNFNRPPSPIKVETTDAPVRSLTNLEQHLNSLEGSGFRNQSNRNSKIIQEEPELDLLSSPKKSSYTLPQTSQDNKRIIELPVSSRKIAKINPESLLKDAISSPSGTRFDSSQIQTISIEVLSVSPSGSTTAIPSDENNILYSNELLVIIHRYKEASGLTSTKLYSRMGKDFRKILKAGRASSEERKLKEISERYHSKIIDSEPPELIEILGGFLIKRDGIRKNWDGSNTYMLKIRGVDDAGIEIDQVELTSENLDSLNCFIISLLGDLILWFGNGSTKFERTLTFSYAKSLSGSSQDDDEFSSIYQEGKEDEFFWTFFENQDYFKPKSNDSLTFRSSLKSNEIVRSLYQIKSMKDQYQLVKSDSTDINVKGLYKDQIYLLETNLELFLIIGEEVRSDRDSIQVGLDLLDFLKDYHFELNIKKRSSFFKPNASVLILPSKLPRSLISIKGFENENDENQQLLINVLTLKKAREEVSRVSWPVEVLKDQDHLPLGVGKDSLKGLL